jgi:long-chain acyl-CoA synthetase
MSTTDQPTAVRGVTAHARRRGDHPALVHGDHVRTYGELDDRARRLAAVLERGGVGPGRPVATVLPNGFEPFEVAIAASMLDAPYLPVNYHLRADELSYILEDAGAAVVVGHSSLEHEVVPATERAGVPGGLLLVGENYERELDTAPDRPDLDSGPMPELMFYTSGTTARPKGILPANRSDRNGRRAGMEGQASLWSWTEDDVYVMSGPAYHASHCGWALTALFVGATTVITDRFDARGFLGEISRRRGTRSFMVPAHFIRILELPEEERSAFDTSSFSLVVHAAAPCPVVVKQRMMEAFPHTEIHELYGASEGGATRIGPDEWRARPGSVGRPWPGVEIRILDEQGEALPAGESGLVYIRPAGGRRFTYRNDDAATEKAWRDDVFTVGDIGFLDEEGYLTITDRASDMVLWGGVNIAPREIEEVLYEHPDVVDCAVFGIPDERDGEHLKAMVQLRQPIEVGELEAHVRSRLASYKVPHVWEVTDELPRDQNGKVLKRLLRAAHDG